MASADGIYSPESSVTSLLGNSGRLESSLFPDSSDSIRYSDKPYTSATEALDAYIADFQLSLRNTEFCTGKLQLVEGPITPVLSKARFRNKDVLKENLTDGELSFLNLPIGSHQRDPDRLSLTTDDLLVLPSDGSLPITHTSAYLTQSGSYHLSHGFLSRSLSRSNSVPHLTRDRSIPQETFQGRKNHEKNQELKDFLGSQPNHRAKGIPGRNQSPSVPLHSTERGLPRRSCSPHYPRWLTSQKSLMDFSGISSIPNLTYPTWLKEYEVPADSPRYSVTRKRLPHGPTRTLPPKVSPELGDLEAYYEELRKDSQSPLRLSGTDEQQGIYAATRREVPDHRTLRELRLELQEHLALAEEGGGPADGKHFRDDKIESLILKAEKALNSPSLGLSSHVWKEGSSPQTEDILDADRSWDNPPFAFKHPVPVGGAEDQRHIKSPLKARHLESCLSDHKEAPGSCSSGYSSRKHPGPVEALKQMLFSLQAVEQQVSSEQGGSVQDSQVLEQCQRTHEISELSFDEYGNSDGNQSLQRALHHLGRLKGLVDDMNVREKKPLA